MSLSVFAKKDVEFVVDFLGKIENDLSEMKLDGGITEFEMFPGNDRFTLGVSYERDIEGLTELPPEEIPADAKGAYVFNFFVGGCAGGEYVNIDGAYLLKDHKSIEAAAEAIVEAFEGLSGLQKLESGICEDDDITSAARKYAK